MSAQMPSLVNGWLAQALAMDSPLLPTHSAMQIWLHMGLSMVLAWLGLRLTSRLKAGWAHNKQVQWLVVLGLAAWAWLPGPSGAAYWLGLAFQAPSATSVLLCAALLVVRWRAADGANVTPGFSESATSSRGPALWLAGLAALLGWALLLDSFAVLPLQLYAFGFSPVAVFLVMVLGLLPWVFGCYTARDRHLIASGVVLSAALVFVVWRLPTGNVWDAVLDPWLWVALQVYLVRGFFRLATHA